MPVGGHGWRARARQAWAVATLLVLGACGSVDSAALGEFDPEREPDELSAVNDLQEPVGSDELAPGVAPRQNEYDFQLGSLDPVEDEGFDPNRYTGGEVDGLWSVVETLNPVTVSAVLLQRWGEQSMDLDVDSCLGAVNQLEVHWAGDLWFRWLEQEVIDFRQETRVADIEVDRECLGAALGVDAPVNASHANCSALERRADDGSLNVNCTSEGERCVCRGRRVSPHSGSHSLGGTGSKLRMGDRWFDYSVIGDHLYFRENTNHIVVFERHGTSNQSPVIEREPIFAEPR